jgi:hypothetical protein
MALIVQSPLKNRRAVDPHAAFGLHHKFTKWVAQTQQPWMRVVRAGVTTRAYRRYHPGMDKDG